MEKQLMTSQEDGSCWICGTHLHNLRGPSAETNAHGHALSEAVSSVAAARQIGRSATSDVPAVSSSICAHCIDNVTQRYDGAWSRLSIYLHKNWQDIVKRGSFDLSRPFASETSSMALDVHL